MGNRFRGGIAPGAMPPMHRYFGNPFLTALGRLFFSCKEIAATSTAVCAVFEKNAIQALGSAKSRDGVRLGDGDQGGDAWSSHHRGADDALARWSRPGAAPSRRYRDGWRSLRFYLLMSPRWFFGIPGLILFIGGRDCFGAPASRVRSTVASVTFDYHTFFIQPRRSCSDTNRFFSLSFAKLMAVETGLHPPQTKFWFLEQRKTLGTLCDRGIALILMGLFLGIVAAHAVGADRVSALATCYHHPIGHLFGSVSSCLAARPFWPAFTLVLSTW